MQIWMSKSGRTFITNNSSLGSVNVTGGQLWAQDEDNLSASNTITKLTLNTSTNDNSSLSDIEGLQSTPKDGLVLGLGPNKRPALTVTEKFQYDKGNIFLYAPNSIDPSQYAGNWKPLDFKTTDLSAEKYSEMFSNTYMMVEDVEGNIGYYRFNSDGSINPLNEESQLLRPVRLRKGSLILEVGEVDLSTASGEGGNSDGNSDSGVNNDSSGTADSAGNSDSGGNGDSGGSSNSSGETIEEEIEDEIIDEIIGGE